MEEKPRLGCLKTRLIWAGKYWCSGSTLLFKRLLGALLGVRVQVSVAIQAALVQDAVQCVGLRDELQVAV